MQDCGHATAKPLSWQAEFIKVRGADNQQARKCPAALSSGNKLSCVTNGPDRGTVRQFSGALPYPATSLHVRPLLAGHEA
ncbi:hypothetical protein BIY29_08310 [Brenneria alni]|uniref:Uncharacterized protein n=1 Tax=Brenneria alni TaxID=71656 RepID=A0A421DPH4_9GAMM|nr:hypothetical protein BIY29_08310 [Brenneria alni]